jgi:hypothetical protein
VSHSGGLSNGKAKKITNSAKKQDEDGLSIPIFSECIRQYYYPIFSLAFHLQKHQALSHTDQCAKRAPRLR